MLTKVGIIYSLAQLQRRELIISDVDDANIDLHKGRMLAGEGWIDCPISIYNSFTDANGLDAWLATVLGEKTSHRCAVIDGETGIVQAVVGADPIIDQHPDGIIIQDDTAQAGWTYDFVNAAAIDTTPQPTSTPMTADQRAEMGVNQ